MAFFGIKAKNEEQKRAMQSLLSDKPFTFLTGQAGTGKTLIAQAVGLHQVVENQKFQKMNYTRLQVQMGQELGYLTGDINAKSYPFIAPFLDNFELMSNKDALEYLIMGDERKRKIFFDPIQTMRGRSFHHSYTIIDESQNLDASTIAAIATRLSSGKIIFLGNFSQIDNPKLRNKKQNGLFQLLDGLYERKAHKYFDHINLNEVNRHPVVGIVEDILRNHELDKDFEELERRGDNPFYEYELEFDQN